jgi:hypothetical protein
MASSAPVSSCSCISLSATSESFGGPFKTTLKPSGYVDGRKSYSGFDPCCGQSIEIIKGQYKTISISIKMISIFLIHLPVDKD